MWLAQGDIPLSWMAEEEEAVQIAHDGAPVEIPSSKIQWPAILFESFRLARLIQCHGPLFRNGKGRRILNEFFWANWLVEKLDLIYEAKLSAFRRVPNDGT